MVSPAGKCYNTPAVTEKVGKKRFWQMKSNVNWVSLLVEAFKKSYSGTVDIVIEHHLYGITPQMIDWWWIHSPEYYKLWHPADHISTIREVIPDKTGGPPTRISHIIEGIGEYPPVELILRSEDPASHPIPTRLDRSRAATFIGPGNQPYSWLLHDYKAESYGTRMVSTFRFPVKTPEQFLTAMRRHNKEEMGELPKFLPEIFNRNRSS